MSAVPHARGRRPAEAETAAARAARVDALLGDPSAPGNPAGHRASLDADRTATVPAGAESVLEDFGMNAELVPWELGGRFDSVEGLSRVLRPVFRRDVALGAGTGLSAFVAASAVWQAGSPGQREWLARRLLSGGKAATVAYEAAHTRPYPHGEVTAVPAGDGSLSVTGLRRFVINLWRADALIVLCRDTERHGDDGDCVLLVDPRELPADRYRAVRHRVPERVGLRCYVRAGAWFDACPVPRGALLGPAGTGSATSLLSVRIHQALMAAATVAALDTTLRTAVGAHRTARRNRHDRQPGATLLTGAFVDLLTYDSLATAATRSLRPGPAEAGVHAAAAASLQPQVCTDTTYDMAVVLGTRFHTADGAVGMLHKNLKDMRAIGLGQAGAACGRSLVVAELPRLARGSSRARREAPAVLFRPDAGLPPSAYGESADAGGLNGLGGTLLARAASLSGQGPVGRSLRTVAERLRVELRELRLRALALAPPEPNGAAGPAWCALADRYAWVLAAEAALGVWYHRRDDAFLADPAWVTIALHRVAGRLGLRAAEPPADCALRVHQEVLGRFGERRSYDLYGTAVMA
ncbi:acyl-CoA dehydrogenase [Streptomyces sp. NPDC085944]|uniref:acyl-CoA dehydrogenase n=1 Tax=Streptomyces sp. NPDC085944 TaxID=3154962 RepID=UPI00341B9CE9